MPSTRERGQSGSTMFLTGGSGATAGAAGTSTTPAGRSAGRTGAAPDHGDGGQQFDRVGVAPGTARRRGRLAHRATDLESVTTGAAAEVVTRHIHSLGRRRPGAPPRPRRPCTGI